MLVAQAGAVPAATRSPMKPMGSLVKAALMLVGTAVLAKMEEAWDPVAISLTSYATSSSFT